MAPTQCYICGKNYGTHSIKIHQNQCLKKWYTENTCPPPDIRSTPLKESSKQETVPKETLIKSAEPPLFSCYICGELFTVHSIYLHEPECLKSWKIENEKLPPNKRKQQPLKPDVKFTPTGDVDFIGTFHRIWDNHLAELVECRKCQRKFFPDRIEIHERACAGLRVKIKKK